MHQCRPSRTCKFLIYWDTCFGYETITPLILLDKHNFNLFAISLNHTHIHRNIYVYVSTWLFFVLESKLAIQLKNKPFSKQFLMELKSPLVAAFLKSSSGRASFPIDAVSSRLPFRDHRQPFL